MISAKDFWIRKFGENPETDSEKLAVAMMREYVDFLISHMNSADMLDANDFLNKKDIWNHPRVSTKDNNNSYEVAKLMADFANDWINKML